MLADTYRRALNELEYLLTELDWFTHLDTGLSSDDFATLRELIELCRNDKPPYERDPSAQLAEIKQRIDWIGKDQASVELRVTPDELDDILLSSGRSGRNANKISRRKKPATQSKCLNFPPIGPDGITPLRPLTQTSWSPDDQPKRLVTKYVKPISCFLDEPTSDTDKRNNEKHKRFGSDIRALAKALLNGEDLNGKQTRGRKPSKLPKPVELEVLIAKRIYDERMASKADHCSAAPSRRAECDNAIDYVAKELGVKESGIKNHLRNRDGGLPKKDGGLPKSRERIFDHVGKLIAEHAQTPRTREIKCLMEDYAQKNPSTLLPEDFEDLTKPIDLPKLYAEICAAAKIDKPALGRPRRGVAALNAAIKREVKISDEELARIVETNDIAGALKQYGANRLLDAITRMHTIRSGHWQY